MVKQHWLWVMVCVCLIAIKLWLVSGVELGKDEAAYWFWSQHLDASYALLPIAAVYLSSLVVPDSEIAVRLPSMLAGVASLLLMYRLCRQHRLSEKRALLATCLFATSHWIWHTTSFLHPDAFLVLCWLLTLLLARTYLDRPSTGLAFAWGAAAALASLSKYHGALLALSMFAWLALYAPTALRLRHAGSFGLALVIFVSPLAYETFASDFHMFSALGSLSRIAADSSLTVRVAMFAIAPLLFVSPILLYLLYVGSGRCAIAMSAVRSDRARWREFALAAFPAATVICYFAFFALTRGQVKGNWILPAFLSIWPWVLGGDGAGRRHGRSLITAALLLGFAQTAAVGLSLKSPALAAAASRALGEYADRTYHSLVSDVDRIREPSTSWMERACEYTGWRAFTADLDDVLVQQGIDAKTPLVSSQYDLVFGYAFYRRSRRPAYTIDDPKFAQLSDFQRLRTSVAAPNDNLLFAVRSGSPVPASLLQYRRRIRLPGVTRRSASCGDLPYDLVLLRP